MQGRLQACPGPAGPPSSPSSHSRGRAGTFPGRKSFHMSDLDPSCCGFSKRRPRFSASRSPAPASCPLGCLRVSHSRSTLSHAPHLNNQVQIFLYLEERFEQAGPDPPLSRIPGDGRGKGQSTWLGEAQRRACGERRGAVRSPAWAGFSWGWNSGCWGGLEVGGLGL